MIDVDEPTLCRYLARTTIETPYTSLRFLPLCRAIKRHLTKEGHALGTNVESELLKTNANILNWLDLDTFSQYVYEARREGVGINFTLNVDDKIAKLYFCLTASMVGESYNDGIQNDRSGSKGPLLSPRYKPLYQSMRKCMTDQGYAQGCDVDDDLMKADMYIYHRLELDSLFEYVVEAMGSKAPIGLHMDVDYVEKLWFVPTDGMVRVGGE